MRLVSTRAPFAEFDANNALWLHKLREEGSVKIRKFYDSVLKALREISKKSLPRLARADEFAKKIYSSYQQFRTLITDWSDISERAVLNSRVA